MAQKGNSGAANLKPVQKGDQGRNPKGRPKGALNRTTILRRWLEAAQTIKNPITQKDDRLMQADMIVLAQIKAAREGDLKSAEWLFDGWLGKMVDKQELTGANGEALIKTDPISREALEARAKLLGVNLDDL